MVAKNRTRTKSRGPKASQTKLANKRSYKLAKQGKSKKKNSKKNLVSQNEQKSEIKSHAEPDVVCGEEEDVSCDDLEYYSKVDTGGKFLANANLENSQSSRRQRKRQKESDDGAAYEEAPRKRFHEDEKKHRHLLPIKAGNKVIAQSIEEENDEEVELVCEDAETNLETVETKCEDSLPAVSTVELYASRQRKLQERKIKIANAASSLLEEPRDNISQLKELRMLMEENDPEIYLTVRKYAILSLMEVFKDIIPDYRIRTATEKEKLQAQKKETLALRDFEETLLHNYKLYLHHLENLLKGNKGANGKVAGSYIPERAMRTFRELSVVCMCNLLTTHPDFNFRSNLVATLVPFIVHINAKISDTICDCIKLLFKSDRDGQISLEICQQISKLLKSRTHDVQPKVLATFLALKIKEVDFEREKTENKMTRKERFLKMSRRERKRDKKMKNLNKELEEVALTEDKNKKLQLHTRIVEIIFMIYFRVLKSVGDQAVLLSTVLEGLAKFAHLINVDFFNDLFNVINELVESEELTLRDRLYCIKTAFTILTGQGAALNIDPLAFYTHLYKIIYKLREADDVKLLLECLEMMLLKRRKQVTQQRALAYIKRLSAHSLQLAPHATLGLLSAVRLTIHAFVKSDMLYDREELGSGLYLPELDQPEYCNAQNTLLWEFHLLRRHYHPSVRVFGEHMARGAPTSGQQQIPPQLRKEPLILFDEASPKDKLFYPEVVKPKTQKKLKRSAFICEDYTRAESNLNNYSQLSNIELIDFSEVMYDSR